MAKADRTLQLKRTYLEALSVTGIINYAAAAARVARSTVYYWLGDDPDFARRHEEAITESTERMEQEAWRRATQGVEKPVYYKGEQVGSIREHSDTLLIFMLKARKPETYRERVDVDAKVRQQLTLAPDDLTANLLEHLTDDDLNRLASALLAAPTSATEPR
jgi:hypothetical protein